MSSDLPAAHASPEAMARSLVTYIGCPERVQRIVKAEWGTSPSLQTIKDARAAYLSPIRVFDAPTAADAHVHGRDAADLFSTNRDFVRLLQAERRCAHG